MKLLVIGATGGTGREIIRQASAAGYQLVALIRRPEALLPVPGMEVVKGDITDARAIREAVEDCDAVVSSLGIGGLRASRHAGTLLSAGTGLVVSAMRNAGVKRLVVVSSVGVEDDPTEGFVYRRILKPLFLNELYSDMRVMERTVAESDLEWTLVRPPRLVDGPGGGAFKVRPGGNVPFARTMTRSDLAGFLIRLASGFDYARTVVGVSHEGRD